MDGEQRLDLLGLYNRTQDVAHALRALSEEVYEMAREFEGLTKDTLIRHAGVQARVEAGATQEQAADLRRALEELSEKLRGEVP